VKYQSTTKDISKNSNWKHLTSIELLGGESAAYDNGACRVTARIVDSDTVVVMANTWNKRICREPICIAEHGGSVRVRVSTTARASAVTDLRVERVALIVVNEARLTPCTVESSKCDLALATNFRGAGKDGT